jgi:hypothetical protein
MENADIETVHKLFPETPEHEEYFLITADRPIPYQALNNLRVRGWHLVNIVMAVGVIPEYATYVVYFQYRDTKPQLVGH